VSIGDRSRLRRPADLEFKTQGSATVEMSKTQDGSKQTEGDDTEHPQGQRQLQDGGGLSGDSLALVATAILGMASFLVQARLSTKDFPLSERAFFFLLHGVFVGGLYGRLCENKFLSSSRRGSPRRSKKSGRRSTGPRPCG
jgi:hypothetical protein